MVGAVLTSHGQLCSGMKQSLEMVLGSQDFFKTVSFEEGQAPDNYLENLKNTFSEMKDCSVIFCFIDLCGGTPCNSLAVLLETHSHVQGITGVNFPILIEFFQMREDLKDPDKLKEHLMSTGKGGILSLNDMIA